MLDLDRRELMVNGDTRDVEPKVFDLIVYLLTHRDRVVSKEELQESLWPEVVVTEASLSRTVMKARKALDDDAHEPQVIRTLPRRGFRFVAPIEEERPTVFALDDLSDVHFVQNGDVHIAWRTVGHGSPDILFCPGFVSHLDFRYRIQDVADFDARLAKGRRLISFDKRGIGLSDRIGYPPAMEHTVEDMKAVLDDAQAQDVILLAVSESGPAACMFAARYPERVRGLIMYSTFVKAVKSDDYPYAYSREVFDNWLNSLVSEWGGPASLELFAPSAVNDEQFRDGWARYLRAAATPGSIKGVLEVLRDTDVRDVLPEIQCPTLVLHRKGDRLVYWKAGRDMAERIPGARFLALEGDDHWWFVGDSESVLLPMLEFIESLQSPESHSGG